MGLLPQIASGVGISIPVAGHIVSAYARGVVVGAPLIATLAARLPRKSVLLWLMVAFAAGNIASSMAASYPQLTLALLPGGHCGHPGPVRLRRPHNQVAAVLAVFLPGVVPTILVPMLQTPLMDVAHDGQSLAAALNHSTLNMANALGAWLGS